MSTSNYSRRLSQDGIRIVIRAAYADASVYRHDRKTGSSPQTYTEHRSSDEVILVLLPTEHTTWGDWACMLEGLMEFMNKWDNVGLSFVANFVGHPFEPLGTGKLFATVP